MDYFIWSIIEEEQFAAILITRQEKPYDEMLITAWKYSNKVSVLFWVSSHCNLSISDHSEQTQFYLEEKKRMLSQDLKFGSSVG